MDNVRFMKAMIAVFRLIALMLICQAIVGICNENPFVVIVSAGISVIFCKASNDLNRKLKDEKDV